VAHLRRGPRQAELRRAERLLKGGARRADAILAVVIFTLSAIWGSAFYGRYIRTGGHPFFYQTYFEPAVMVACGKGFLVAHPQPPAVRAFLFQETDRFSCDQLPPDLNVSTQGLYQRPWRYLMTTVAIAWKVLGISWSRLAPLFGLFFGATTVLVYALARLVVGRVAASACAAALVVSPIQLANLPHLRDYSKAPFTVALVMILMALVLRPLRARDLLLLSFGYGLVLGVGYGFRTDLLVDIPPFLISVALFLPGGVFRNLPLKAAAVGLCAAGFTAAGWPIITSVASGGGCQWHVFLLGLMSPFNDGLGVTGGSYGWGHLYRDEYVWATVSGYANRFRPDLGYIEYCSHEYDLASWAYLRHVLLAFPADMMTRAYASALQVLGLPFQRVTWLADTGPLLAAVFVLAVSAASLRLALAAVFVMLYFGGHPAIQFLPRHYFPFEFITLVVIAFLAERGARLGIATARGTWNEHASRAALGSRAAVCAVIVATILLVPLELLRWYQNGRTTRLLETYLALSTTPMPLAAAAPGQFRTSAEPGGRVPSSVDVIKALGLAKTRFVEAQLDAAGCAPGTTVTFRYDPGFPATDFSRTVTLERTAEGAGPTRLFEPVYAGFQGIDVSDASPACAPRVSVVNGTDRLPLLLSAQLPPGWKSRPQYQRITRSR
jgi:hypothetical protein